ncbi:MAG: TetR/AcrR family transcriptional regulator [Clostridia bacterium]
MKNRIAETFCRLILEKGIDKITVKDLVENCRISRQTFYYHFQDILDVGEWCAQKVVEKALEKGLAAETPEEAMEAFVSMAVNDHDLLEKLLCSRKREYMESIMFRMVRIYLQEIISHRVSVPAAIPFSDMEMALDFYASGISGMILKYCGKDNMDVKTFSRQLCRILTGLPRLAGGEEIK